MKYCENCGENIPTRIIINSREIVVSRGRKKCFNCSPYRDPSNIKKKQCAICGAFITPVIEAEGKKISTSSRKYCLDCSPFNKRKVWTAGIYPKPGEKGGH